MDAGLGRIIILFEAKDTRLDPMIKSGKGHEVADGDSDEGGPRREEIVIIGSAGMTNEECFLKTLSCTLKCRNC